jgi:hypothetical protein
MMVLVTALVGGAILAIAGFILLAIDRRQRSRR